MIEDAAPRRRFAAIALPARLRARLLNPRVLIALIVLICLLAGGWLWFRDSGLVAVKRVTVTGASGPDAARIRRALIAAADGMTTLDVSLGQLRTAVAPYPVVRDIQVTTQFPHGMRIHVTEENPVALVSVGGSSIAVAGDGTLLHDVSGASALPRIPVQVPPGGTQVTGAARDAVSLLAAAPYQLLSHLGQVTTTPHHGLQAQLRNGPVIYFGTAGDFAAKWAAATAVLANSTSVGASYIDVSDPARPAAGTPTQSGSSGQAATSTSGASAAGTIPAAGSSGAGTTSATGSSGSATTPTSGSPTTTSGG